MGLVTATYPYFARRHNHCVRPLSGGGRKVQSMAVEGREMRMKELIF